MHFIDLKSQQKLIRTEIDQAIQTVLDHGQYILGPEVKQLEQDLCDFSGAKYAISCSSGTDALLMPLLAIDLQANDAVFVPSFTFPASAEVIALLGATPVFVDVEAHSFNMDSASLERAYEEAKRLNLNPKAIIAVDMFGQTANYAAINKFAKANDLLVIADSAQSFGAESFGAKVGTLANVTTTSFFPAKPLGCYGDGGAVFCNDAEMAEKLISIRNHGQGKTKYEILRLGINGRLDTIQAAILIEKLKLFAAEIDLRNQVAAAYNEALADVALTPSIADGNRSVWAQYTLLVANRDAIIAELSAQQIPTAVYYPKPMHEQAPYAQFPRDPQGLAVTDSLSKHVLSLPMHPYLTPEDQQRIITAVRGVAQPLSAAV